MRDGNNPPTSNLRIPLLSAHTVAWLDSRPHARAVIRMVCETLTDLERTAPCPSVITALRSILSHHQPLTPTGGCRGCPRLSWRRFWRRRSFPCIVWLTDHVELFGPFTGAPHRTIE